MQIPDYWNGKPFYSLDAYCRQTFGQKVYKLSLQGGMTCPNRDGTLDTRGCIFCSSGGSGDFAAPAGLPIPEQIETAKARVSRKYSGGRYIAYFQSYTNTYAPVSYLEPLFTAAINHPDILALSVATRPDCLSAEVIALLRRLDHIKPVWVELGLQTIREDTARLIRRAYPLSCYKEAADRLNAIKIPVIAHVILGLPGETAQDMLATVRYICGTGAGGIKLQLLHILKGTDLAAFYAANPFPIFTLEEYSRLVVDCISILPPEMVVHRLTGDGPKKLLLEPAWSADKHRVLNHILGEFRRRNIIQGVMQSYPWHPSSV